MIYSIATFIGTVFGCRLAYGCWPWEAYKTWHCTKAEIAYLRAVIDNLVPPEKDQ